MMNLKIVGQYILVVFISIHIEAIRPNKFIPPNQLSPTNIDTSKVISVKSAEPLTIHFEKYSLEIAENTGNALIFHPLPFSRLHIEGGLLGGKTYHIHRNFLHLNQNAHGRSGSTINAKCYPIEGVIIFYNEAYGTYENAMNFSDGLLVLSELVRIGSKDNSDFVPLEKILLSGALKKPNSSVVTAAKNLFSWYSTFEITPAYYVYQGSYYDSEIRKQISRAIFVVTQPPYNSISKKQFEAFKQVLGNDGQPFNTITPIYPAKSRRVLGTTGVQAKPIPFGLIVLLLQMVYLYLSGQFT